MTASVRGQFGIAALITVAGTAGAAESLPPLSVDPALLGGSAASATKPRPAPAPAAPAPAESIKPSAAAPAVVPVTAPPAPVESKSATVVAPASTPVVAAPTPVQAAPVAVPAAAPASKTPVNGSVAAVSGNTLSALAPLRVDPALLGNGVSFARAHEPVPQVPAQAVAPVAPAVSAAPLVALAEDKKPAKNSRRKKSAASDPRQQQLPFAETASTASVTAVAAGAPSTSSANASAPLNSQQPPLVEEGPVVPPLYSAYARAGLLPDVVLKATAEMQKTERDPNVRYPVFVAAERIDGQTDQEVIAKGNVELRKKGTTLNADQLTYWPLDDETEAVGNVKLVRDDDVVTGPKLRMRMDENVGYFDQPTYVIRRESKINQDSTNVPSYPGLLAEAPKTSKVTTGYGTAERINFEGEGQYRMSKATYSTCTPGDGQDWYAEMGDLKLDYDREEGTGSDARLVFKGVPILYSPTMSFSLNNQRKSGLLAPTFGSNSRTGFEYTQPWYWNIAPNMDATISPRYMSKRGVQWNTELRYTDFNYQGTSRFEYLPDDQNSHRRRSAYAITHTQNFGAGFSGGVNLNGVSDDDYFTDLATRVSAVSQGNLVRQGNILYSGGWWSVNAMAQRYQTLQDPTAPIVPPYARLPQVTLAAARPDLPFGAAFNLNSEYVSFSHPTSVLGQRTVFYPQISLPIQTSAFYVTPKIGVHSTRYTLQRQDAGTPDQLSRTVPIVSLDTGLAFERGTEWFGQEYTQTLEPRLYYLYVPRRDQSQIPVFDSALADFNFAQIFSENRYGGSDRIGDANQITAAVTSRIIDPATGAELIRGMLGQRYYFSSQNVTLPGEVPRVSKNADLLAALSGRVMPRTYLDSGVQYNPRDSRMERFNLSARYQPELGKVMNAGYRYTRDVLGQIDVSGQWPLGNGWYGVGRYNFSTKEKRIVEAVAGFEYNAGCWAIRTVLQQVATTAQSKTTSFFIQLELNGFSSIGSNPNEILRRNIPGYGKVDQSVADPVFGTN